MTHSAYLVHLMLILNFSAICCYNPGPGGPLQPIWFQRTGHYQASAELDDELINWFLIKWILLLVLRYTVSRSLLMGYFLMLLLFHKHDT